MTSTTVLDRDDELFAYEAPLLLEKLRDRHVVSTDDEARALFREVKRYLVLLETVRRPIPVFSVRVDEAWHQFVLFTQDYAAFCERFFGRYLHHAPTRADAPASNDTPEIDYEEFTAAYRARFGCELDPAWDDLATLDASTRVIRRVEAEPLQVETIGGGAELHGRFGDVTRCLLRVNAAGARALAFVASTEAFYVRELPGAFSTANRIELCRQLASVGVLRVAAA